VVGLAVAVSLARRGASVRVLEREARCGEGASGAAAGMLAEGAEATEAGPFQGLCRSSRELWPSWSEELRRTTGVDCELDRTGLVRVTNSAEGRRRLEQQSSWQKSHGVEVSSLLGPSQLAQLVPGLGPAALAGLHYPNDWHVHSHRVVEALIAACAVHGVKIETETEVSAIESRPGGSRLSLVDGRTVEADYVVVCAGSWSGRLLGFFGAGETAVEPVRGQIVAIDPGRPLLSVILFGDHGYLLQKRSGLVLAGTTEEHVGYQPWPTVDGVRQVVAVAVELLPELSGARFAYAWAGLRPRGPDGRPLLGRTELGGRMLLATAHYRNGVLLAPVTGELIARAVFEGADPPELEAFSPRRFA
jgi:glycine oxidase